MRNRTKDNFLVFGSPMIEDAEINELVKSMKTGWLGTGPKVERFEHDFSKYKGVDYIAAVNSCTAALHLSILAAGVEPGDEVITTPLTFCATVNAIIHAGATPVLADVNPHTMNIDPEEIEKVITNRTRAVIPVHFAGRPCDMDHIIYISQKNDLKIIEDCAHAIEAEYKGQKTGTFGDFGCFSFYVTKNITTGEGGMVISKQEEDITRIKRLALHGLSKDAWKRFSDEGYKHYKVVECGFKYNMMDLQAAIGIHQIQRIDAYWEKRRDVWESYNMAFSDLPITLPADPEPESKHAYHLYTILVDEESTGIHRDEFLNAMTAQNIGVGVHYISIAEHPYYQHKFHWKPSDYPNAMRIGRQTVSLPISAKLTAEDIEDVVYSVRSVLQV
jgi:dTDP-4-amino-4,6-dideoxygalactose transaminase